MYLLPNSAIKICGYTLGFLGILKIAEFSSVSTSRHERSTKALYFSDTSAHFLITGP